MSINKSAIRVLKVVNVCRPGGGLDIFLDGPDDVVSYLSDADAYAASYFGLSKLDYMEWLQLDGVPLCGARTKTGELCRNLTGGNQLKADKWKALHRKAICKLHGSGRQA